MSEIDPITLISEDGKEFTVSRAAAQHSGFLKDAMAGDWIEGEEGRVRLADMRGEIVEKIAEYLAWKEKHVNNTGKIPDFTERIPKELALELLMASDYLAC